MEVKVFAVKCSECHKEYLIYPSFVLPGTTLTLPALIFVAFAYETSDLTWRETAEKFCSFAPQSHIAHSTMYRAVHGLGERLNDQEPQIREGIEKLETAYPVSPDSQQIQLQSKSLYKRTQERENAVHNLLRPLCHHCLAEGGFFRIFYLTFIPRFEGILSGLSPPQVGGARGSSIQY